jgi:Na+/melibiose symporter-like transporter
MLRGRELLALTKKINQILKFKQGINPKLFTQFKSYSSQILKKEKQKKKDFLSSNQKYALILIGIFLMSLVSFNFIKKNQKYFNVYVSPTEVIFSENF